MKATDEGILFESTGREEYANGSIVGITERGFEPGQLEIHEGYDGTLDHPGADDRFTPEECAELADYMIGLWQRFRSERTSGAHYQHDHGLAGPCWECKLHAVMMAERERCAKVAEERFDPNRCGTDLADIIRSGK